MHTVSELALTAILALSVSAEAQIIVTPMGNVTDISGPNGHSSTQVDLGSGHGVIITDQSTTPYTTLGQPSTPSQLGVPPVPSVPQVGAPVRKRSRSWRKELQMDQSQGTENWNDKAHIACQFSFRCLA